MQATTNAYMPYTAVRNPRWTTAEHVQIDCEVQFAAYGDEWFPFTADPTDIEPHGVEIFNRCVAEEFGPVAEYNAP